MTTTTEEHWLSAKAIKENIRQLFTLEYYKEGLIGWTRQSYMLLTFGIAFLTITALSHSLTWEIVLSWVASLLSFSCVLAISNGKTINGLLGGASAILIGFVAIHQGNPSDFIMQTVYFFVLDLPIILFGGQWGNAEIKGKLDNKGWLIIFATFVMSFTALYFMDASFLNTPRPLIDALAASIGITGATLMLGKYSAQYYFWFLQGAFSVVLWGITAAQGDGNWVLFANYMLFILNDLIGLFNSPWSRARKS